MKLYRAVDRKRYKEDEVVRRNPGRRLPSNIPYLVDNLLEFARPAGMPSRRHSIYASPTPELALTYAVSAGTDRSAYVVCELQFAAAPKIMQLTEKDAKLHGDVLALQQFVNKRIGNFSASPLEEKLVLAPLSLPGILKEELQSAMTASAFLRELVTDAAATVTFWTPSPSEISPDGELFFELADDNFLMQRPV